MSRRDYDNDRSEQPERPLRAAEYVRMSTDHQKYSTENQSDAIKHYAETRGIEIVCTYADEGKSGLSVDGRDAFRRSRNQPSTISRKVRSAWLRSITPAPGSMSASAG